MQHVVNFADVETLLRSLVRSEHGSLSIEFNQHAAFYETVEQALECETYQADAFVSDEERERSIATGNVWSIQVYPDCPVGFFLVHASTLQACIDKAQKIGEETNADHR